MPTKLTDLGTAVTGADTVERHTFHRGSSARRDLILPSECFCGEHAVATRLKYILTRVGGYLSSRTAHSLNACLNYLEVGRWIREKGYRPQYVFSKKQQFWNLIGQEIGDRKVLYLEFGVWQGNATRAVAKQLSHPEAMLHGFDSFKGLPERWNFDADEGCFSTGGQLPQIDDPRVQFHKGWFEDTLPTFCLPPHDVLFINCDADLYSSTMFVLDQLRAAITPGTYLFFDEFSDRNHELRAFDEFLARTRMKFHLLAATQAFDKVLFKCVEGAAPAGRP